GDHGDVQAMLEQAWTRATEHWDEPLGVSLPALAGHLGRHAAHAGDQFERIRLHELYLSCACAAGSPAAHRIFERDYCRPVAARVFRGLDGAAADELRQALREKLLLSRGGREPKIAKYSGRGRLLNWVRVIAGRLRIDAGSAGTTPTTPSELVGANAIARSGNAEQDLLKDSCKRAFSAAFGEALDRLSVRQRNLLRQRLLFGTTVAALAQLHGVNVRTIKRWLADARKTVHDNTRLQLRQRLDLRSGEFDSIVRILDSEMDLSIVRMLSPAPDGSPDGSVSS
ncbi:MAG: hypothetical protein K0V04_37435, partial [Deltaproteobacteria bacterium]|nr:hypothetical protein [Deltaproteobacteria bacterium]